MVRKIIQLTEKQDTALKRLAKSRGVSVAELVREGVDWLLTSRMQSQLTRDERWKRATGLVGRFRNKDGATDVSVNHDKYLAEIYAQRLR